MIFYGPHVEDAIRRGIRLISYDRPGYGGSTPHPGRKVADAAKDVAAIADSLRVDRFAVWGISGGGPHTIACAALLPKRVVAAASLASPAPYPSEGLDWMAGQGQDNIDEFGAALAGAEELSKYLEHQRARMMEVQPGQLAQALESLLPPEDRAVLTGKFAGFLTSNMKDGLKPGYEGWKEDDLAFVADWGFRPSDVSVPLLLWQGRQDKMVPYAHGEWLSKRIGRAEARLTSEDGHLTLYQNRIPETHAWLLKHFS